MKLGDDMLGECIRYVVSHEVGHCLSLMHNMAGSSAIPTDSLRSPAFTQKYGTTYSIMDYARNNYIAQPGDKERGVRLTPPELGIYDYFSIKWLYTPFLDMRTPEEEVPVLSAWISEKSGDPIYRYGKQQLDVHIDPSSMEEDLGDNAVKSAEYGVRNLKYVLEHLNEWVGKKDFDYSFRARMYNEVLYQYLRYVNHVLSNIGGIYLNERYASDKRPSYQPVPKERQKQALHFLLQEMKDLSWLNGEQFKEGFALSGNMSNLIEDELFESLMNCPFALNLCAEKTKSNPYTEEEFMEDFSRFVWESTRKGKTLTETEKSWQIKFLTHVFGNAGVQKGLNEESMGALAFTANQCQVAIPEVIKERSRSYFGILPPSILGRFTNQVEQAVPICTDNMTPREKAGFGFFVAAQQKGKPMEHFYFSLLKDIQRLLKEKANTGSSDTREHYRLLLYKIEKALK